MDRGPEFFQSIIRLADHYPKGGAHNPPTPSSATKISTSPARANKEPLEALLGHKLTAMKSDVNPQHTGSSRGQELNWHSPC